MKLPLFQHPSPKCATVKLIIEGKMLGGENHRLVFRDGGCGVLGTFR